MAGEYIEFNNNSQPAVNDTNLNTLQQLIKQDIQAQVSGDTLPIGAIMPFGSNTIPDNWLLCDGRLISRTEYQELFNTIGTTFGAGDGFTTFALPNLAGKVPVGLKSDDTDFDTLGNTGGEKEHTLTVNEIPSHNHDQYVTAGASGSALRNDYANNNRGQAILQGISTGNKGGGEAHNNLQPYIVQNYIIKAKQSAGIVATVVDTLTSTSATNALSANQGKVLDEKFSKNVLWQNSSPTSEFNAQTITLSSSNYNYLMIYYARTPSTRNEVYCAIVEKNKMTELLYNDVLGGVARSWSRSVTISNNTSIAFGDCEIQGGTNNAGLVPQKIIGGIY